MQVLQSAKPNLVDSVFFKCHKHKGCGQIQETSAAPSLTQHAVYSDCHKMSQHANTKMLLGCLRLRTPTGAFTPPSTGTMCEIENDFGEITSKRSAV